MSFKRFKELTALKPDANSPFTSDEPGEALKHEDVIKHYGKAKRLADALGLTESGVSQWRRGHIPIQTAFAIQAATHGALKVSLVTLAKHYPPEPIKKKAA